MYDWIAPAVCVAGATAALCGMWVISSRSQVRPTIVENPVAKPVAEPVGILAPEATPGFVPRRLPLEQIDFHIDRFRAALDVETDPALRAEHGRWLAYYTAQREAVQVAPE